MLSREEGPRTAPWILCPCCPEYWCLIHGRHAFECPCPPVEEWDASPYAPAMTLAARLQRLLADRGFSISEAARIAGMENQQAWRIVTGRTPNPGILTVQRLVEAVGGTMAELFAEDEDPSEPDADA